MFAQIALFFVYVSALAAGVVALPYRTPAAISKRSDYSFNNWGAIASMNNFDNFNGAGNFDGSKSTQIIVQQQTEVVCHTQQIEIIQQRLVVLQEMAKRIITETICEVETQTIVFEQFRSGMSSFSGDLRRQSGKQVGYDSNVAGKYNSLMNSDGSLNTNDLAFNGSSVGANTVVPSGNNWSNSTSFTNVNLAYNSAREAADSLH